MKEILYIAYNNVTNGKASSGSAVRPKRIYEAFLKRGYNVSILEGTQLRSEKDNRLKRISNIETLLNEKEFNYCYIELPTTPITFKQDLQLIKKIKKQGIKVGGFYRDFYWKYPNIWNVYGIRKFYLLMKYKRELKIFEKYFDVLFFPTEGSIHTFKKYEALKNVKTAALPPGIDFAHEVHGKLYNNLIIKSILY